MQTAINRVDLSTAITIFGKEKKNVSQPARFSQGVSATFVGWVCARRFKRPPPAIFVPDLAKVTDHRVIAVAQAMAQNLKQHHSIESLAHGVNLSVNQLEGLFKHELACSPLQYLMSLRLMQACVLLETTELRVGEIMRKVGFKQTGYFSATFRAAFDCTPKEYRAHHRQQMNAVPADERVKI